MRLVLGSLRASALLGGGRDILVDDRGLVLGPLRTPTLLGGIEDILGDILDLVLGSDGAATLLRFSRDILGDILNLVLRSDGATALLRFSRDILGDILVLGPLRAPALLGGGSREDKIMNLDLEVVCPTVKVECRLRDILDERGDMIGDGGGGHDVSESLKVVCKLFKSSLKVV